MKQCVKCKEYLDYDYFYKEYRNSVNVCKSCTQKQRKSNKLKECCFCKTQFTAKGKLRTCSAECRAKHINHLQSLRRASTKKPKKNKREYVRIDKTCIRCSSALLGRARKYCSVECNLAEKRRKNQTVNRDARIKYFTKYNKEKAEELKAWVKNNRDRINKAQRKRRTGSEEYTTYEPRQVAIKNGFRSGFEMVFSEYLNKEGLENNYEPKDKKLQWFDMKPHKYSPDWVFKKRDGTLMYIELKGELTEKDRMKMLAIKSQHNIDIRMILQDGKTKLYKGSKTTYNNWCEKNGIKYFDCKDKPPTLPEEWKKEL